MYNNITNEFLNIIKSDEQSYDAYIVIKDTNQKIEAKGNLASFIYNDAICTKDKLIGNFIKRTIKFTTLDNKYDLADKEIDVFVGLIISKNNVEYIPFGTFKVSKPTIKDEAAIENEYIAEDLTYKFNKKIEPNKLQNSKTIKELLDKICSECGILCAENTFCNANIELQNVYYDTESTYRDLISIIAKDSGTNAKIGKDNKLHLISLPKTSVFKLSTREQFEHKKTDVKFGPLNSIVISRIIADDGSSTEDVYSKNDSEIIKNGLQELKIESNDLIDNNRQLVANNLLEKLQGFTYFGTNIEIILNPALECGDLVEIEDVNTKTSYLTFIMEHSFKLEDGLASISSESKTKTETDYIAATNKNKRRKTEIKVNKLEGKISAVVEKTTDNTNRIAKLELNEDAINLKVEQSVKTAEIYYALSDSREVAPKTGWTEQAPYNDGSKFMWQKMIITTNDGKVKEAVTCISGADGKNGKDGATGPQGVPGKNGIDGIGIRSVDILYYLSTSSTQLIDGTWSTTAPTWVDGKYMWTKQKTTYTNGTFKESNPVCITGQKGNTGNTGATGKGIKSIKEQYYLSTSSIEQIGGTWKDVQDTWEKNHFFWIRQEITWTDNTSTVTEPVLAMGINVALNETENVKTEIIAQAEKFNSQLTANKDSILAEVSKTTNKIEQDLANSNTTISSLREEVNTKVSSKDLEINVKNVINENGVDKVKTSTGFTFNETGLNVSKSGSEMSTQITEDGMTVSKNEEKMLVANSTGVDAVNLHASTYLIVGNTSRFEDFERDGHLMTGCFWIGETNLNTFNEGGKK